MRVKKEKMEKKYLGKKVYFKSGNFQGFTAEIFDVQYDSSMIYGVNLLARLSDGRIIFIEKSEHFEIIKKD